jgi:hypothetical protein
MKTFTVLEAQDCLAEIISEVNKGELIVLKNGEELVTLHAGQFIDPNEDSPELEAELLKGIDGPVSAYSREEMRSVCEDAIRPLRKK